MRVTPFAVTIIALFISWFVAKTEGQMLSPNFVPTEQFVVLKNGEFLQGRVTTTAEQTTVETEQGSRLILSADQVDFVCESKVDVFWGKCARTKASDLDGQKALFYWCLKHKMFDQAQNQLSLLAEAKDSKATTVEFLDRQLNVAIEQAQKKDLAIAKAAPALRKDPNPINPPQPETKLAFNETNKAQPELSLTPIQSDDAMKSIGTGDLAKLEFDFDYETFRPLPSLTEPGKLAKEPARDQSTDSMIAKLPSTNMANPEPTTNVVEGVIRQVGFEQPIDSKNEIAIDDNGNFAKSSNSNPRANLPGYPSVSIDQRPTNPEIETKPEVPNNEVKISIAELDKFTRSMPKGTLGPYRSKLEHVLNNGCNAANCHDSTAAVMPLLSLGRNKSIPRRMSQRNLFNTLKYVDKTQPLASSLLNAASKPHAGMEKPVLVEGSKTFEQLKLWVVMLSDDPNGNYQAYLNSKSLPKMLNVGSSEFQPADPDSSEALAPPNSKSEPILRDSSNQQSNVLPIKPKRAALLPSAAKIPKTIGEIPELNSSSSAFQPVDPFDPEIFNRKFGDK